MNTHTRETGWLEIFKHEATKQTIYLIVFIIFVLNIYWRIDGALSQKYATCQQIDIVKTDLTELEKRTEKSFDDQGQRFDRLDRKMDDLSKMIYTLTTRR